MLHRASHAWQNVNFLKNWRSEYLAVYLRVTNRPIRGYTTRQLAHAALQGG